MKSSDPVIRLEINSKVFSPLLTCTGVYVIIREKENKFITVAKEDINPPQGCHDYVYKNIPRTL